jgi:DNA-directed RNA polymerase specialized sigma24 family protein
VDEHIRNAMVSLYPRLRRFATTLTGSVQDGDDLVHQACERALSKTAQWRPGTRLDSWLYRIIHNVNQRRRHLFRRSVQAEFSWRRENNGGLDG